jgi:2,3-dihydroxybenzoate---[aryl-carrier protein] ligase
MFAGTVPWPAEMSARYRREGYWDGTGLFDIVRRGAARLPAQIALVDRDRRWTYAELQRDATRLAARLLALGLAPRDRVVMQMPNAAEFVLVYFALARIGAIPVMALRSHRQAELRHFLNASAATAYVIGDHAGSFDFRTMADTLRAEAPALRHVIVAGEPLPGQHALAELLRDGEVDEPPVTVDPTEIGTILLSGGTTSMSKLIPRTHQDYVLNARLCGATAGFDERTVFLAILPLGHNYNLASPGILGALTFGGTVVLSSADTDSVFATVQRERVTVIAAVVPLIAGWLEAGVEQRFDLSSLRVVQNGGARLAPELRQRLRERFGVTPQEIYGTAEGLINMTRLEDDDERLLHSSGAPVCDADEIVVVDDEGDEVPDGEAGELLTRGPYTIRGYYDAAEKNAEAFTPDGFYRMGDIVRRRGRYLYAEGRRKDFVNRGGEKISCEEIEALMLTHPKVKLAALVAMPDPVFGEKACAFVVPHPGETLGFAELITFLRAQQIAAFKLPERLEVATELPLSPVGKILKRELREIIAAKLMQEQPR